MASDQPVTALVYNKDTKSEYVVEECVLRQMATLRQMLDMMNEGSMTATTEERVIPISALDEWSKSEYINVHDLYDTAFKFAKLVYDQRDEEWSAKSIKQIIHEEFRPPPTQALEEMISGLCSKMEITDFHARKRMTVEYLLGLCIVFNHLEFQRGHDLVTMMVADMVRNADERSIFRLFGIEREITEEERRQVYHDNPWLGVYPGDQSRAVATK